MIYNALFGGLVLLRAILPWRRKVDDSFYWIVLAILFLFVGFRFEVGCDWSGYLVHYRIQGDAGYEEALLRREPGWWALVETIEQFDLPYPALNVAVSVIFFFGLHALARRQPDPLGFLILAFPLLIVNIPMSALRQAAAVGLICIAFLAFLDRRLLRFLFWMAVASLFHSSAIVFLLLAPMVHGSYTKARLFASALLAIPGLFMLANTPAGEWATDRYIESSNMAHGAVFRLATLSITGLLFFLLARRPWSRHFAGDYKFASLGALMMLAIFPMAFYSSIASDRFGYYLMPIQLMILARLPQLFRVHGSAALYLSPYLAMGLVFLVWTQLSWHFDQCYQPYRSWLFGLPQAGSY